jgi:pseudouridine kinase
MDAIEGMDTAWITARLEVINAADAVVADSNLMPGTLAFLIDHCEKPLYLDAVSVAKAARIRKAMAISSRQSVFALKCNALEYETLAGIEGVTRLYESAGAEGLRVHAGGKLYEYPAFPCIVRSVTGGGDALLAGIVHAGPQASVAESARIGLLCARCAVESPAAVNPEMKNLKL